MNKIKKIDQVLMKSIMKNLIKESIKVDKIFIARLTI